MKITVQETAETKIYDLDEILNEPGLYKISKLNSYIYINNNGHNLYIDLDANIVEKLYEESWDIHEFMKCKDKITITLGG